MYWCETCRNMFRRVIGLGWDHEVSASLHPEGQLLRGKVGPMDMLAGQCGQRQVASCEVAMRGPGLQRLAGELKASKCEQSGSVSTGKIAEVADADKAPGQDMLAKAAQELCSGERHDAPLVAMSIVFPSKAHAVTIEAEQALIADGYAVLIAAKIAQDVSRPAKRGLQHAPNHAVATCGRGWRRSRVDTDGARCRRSRSLTAKDSAEDLDGEEEGILRMNPARVAWIDTVGGMTSGDEDAVAGSVPRCGEC